MRSSSDAAGELSTKSSSAASSSWQAPPAQHSEREKKKKCSFQFKQKLLWSESQWGRTEARASLLSVFTSSSSSFFHSWCGSISLSKPREGGGEWGAAPPSYYIKAEKVYFVALKPWQC